MKDWNEIFEKNLKWNGQTGDETVRGTYTFGSEDEKEDFNNSDVDDCYYWEIDEDTIVFYRTAG